MANFQRELLQVLEDGNLGAEFVDGPRGGCLIDDALLRFFHFRVGRIFEIVKVVLAEVFRY